LFDLIFLVTLFDLRWPLDHHNNVMSVQWIINVISRLCK